MLTDSPLIKGLGRLSLEEVVGVAVNACAKEILCTVLGGGGTAMAYAIAGADGADSSAYQSNGMAAAVRVRRTEQKTQLQNY